MAYTPITPADFKGRYPSFAAVSDLVIQGIIDGEVLLYVDGSWPSQATYTQGAMLYTAHALTLDGFGTGAEAQMASKGLGQFQSIRSGALSVSRFAKEAGGIETALGQTSYGQRFLELVRKLFSGPMVANGGTLPVNPWSPTFQTNDGGNE